MEKTHLDNFLIRSEVLSAYDSIFVESLYNFTLGALSKTSDL